MDLTLGSAVIDRLLALPLTYFEKRSVGEMSQRLGELNTIRGFLTGTYRPGIEEVDSTRAAGAREYASDKNFAIISAMDKISVNHNNAPLSAIALAWLRAQPTVSAPIASARTVAQLEEIIQVIKLTNAEVEELNALS